MKYRLIFFVVLLLLEGCDIFSTRDAEKPVTSRSSFQFPSSPQIVIQNLTNSLLEKNTQDYTACIADSNYFAQKETFKFIPSAGLTYPFLADGWSIKSEEQYIKNIFAKLSDNDQVVLTLSNDKLYPYGDSTVYTADYDIQLPQKTTLTATHFQGSLSFAMRVDSRSEWVITRWTDIKSSSSYCWSDLKGLYYN